MRLLVTGATGVIGRNAVPHLVEDGHHVLAVVRRAGEAERMRELGAEPIDLDLFDPEAVRSAVRRVDGIVHLATSIPPLNKMHRRRHWRTNDRLRDEATAMLVDTAIESGAQVLVFPSITFNYADGGAEWLDEDAPIVPPFGATESALAAEQHVARFAAAGGRGVVLRLGRLYGPTASREQLAQARAGRAIVVGAGDNHVPGSHESDVGRAVAAAIDAPSGVYNVTDDASHTALEVTTAMTRSVAADDPKHVPTWLARLVAGKASRLLTVSQRVSNRRFKRATGWAPRYDAVNWWRGPDRPRP